MSDADSVLYIAREYGSQSIVAYRAERMSYTKNRICIKQIAHGIANQILIAKSLPDQAFHLQLM